MDIQKFIERFKHTFVYELLSKTITDEQLFEHVIDKDGAPIWFKDQTRQMWFMWQAAKAQVPEWISVNDMLPDFGCRVLVFNGKYVDIGNYANRDGNYTAGFWNDGFGSFFEDITHWMPLPHASQEQA